MNYKKIILSLGLGVFLFAGKSATAQTVVTFSYTGSLQSWTVPSCVSAITISAGGGQGGATGGGNNGATIAGTFTTTPGDVIDIVVGGQGITSNDDYSGGGGGGSYVWDNNTTTLMVAAGAGGGNTPVCGGTGGVGSATTSTTAGGGGQGSAAGGSGGNGGSAGSGSGSAGGAGWSSNGANSGSAPIAYGGNDPANGAAGGAAGGYYGGSGAYGGGGGNWESGCGSSGGGGGYNGGGGGNNDDGAGGGGGSYNGGSNQTNTAGGNAGNGVVTITYSYDAVTASVQNNVTCHGGTNGKVYGTITAGASPFVYSWAPSGGTTDTASGLSAGTYTLTVTDPCAHTASASVTVTQPVVLGAASTTINAEVSCNGGNNGSATANISGGTTPYTYLWSNAQTVANATGLTAATYTVTIHDNCGVSASATATITQQAALSSVTANIINNVSCNGSNNGKVYASLSGGGLPYTYSWTNGSTHDTASALSAGSYTITVHDFCGASATASVTITQPTTLGVTAVVSANVSCHGGNNGIAASTPTGGTTPYTYAWSPSGKTTATASNLTAGSYTVTVTDNHGCTATTSVTITQPILLTVTVAATANVNCNGGNNGSASSITGGGVFPYTYSWTNGSSTDTAVGLTAGSYTLNVTDSHGCVASAAVTITQPAAPLIVIANTHTEVTCNAGNNGSAVSTTTGGTIPYTYLWTNGETTANVNGLTAGSYTIYVTDKHGCSDSSSITITEPIAITAVSSVLSNVNCTGGNNGSASTSASGGFIPYTYSWTNGETTAFATGLSAGSYTVNVTDIHGCTATAMVTITQPATSLTISSTTVTNVSCNGGDGGSISTNAAGGVAPYTYAWSSGQSNANIATLTAGSYSVTVTDNNGCSASTMSIITQPAALVISASVINDLNCNGANIGSAISSSNGGVSPYTYAWSNGNTTSYTNDLSAGTYNLTITDGNGCSESATVTITQPTAVTVVIHTTADAGHNTGSVWVVTSGGIEPYTYSWSPGGQATDSIVGQHSGTYCCTITDANGCKHEVCDSIMSDLGVASIASSGTQVSVYPNPNSGQFTIQYSVTGENTVVEIYNVLGSEIYTSTFVSSNSGNTINISNQPAGIYLYRVISSANGNLLGEGKIVLQK